MDECIGRAVAPRLKEAQAKSAWDAIVATLPNRSDIFLVFEPAPRGLGLAALAPRLDQSQANRACDALLALLEKSQNFNVRAVTVQGLVALIPRIERSQAVRAWDALILILEKSTDYDLRILRVGRIGCVGTASGGRAGPACVECSE